ncbi:GDP-D-mannose dehydratase [Bradyrhizobium yuanmingense]
MLRQDQLKDFVIATGVQHSVRDFANAAANEVGRQFAGKEVAPNKKGCQKWAGESLPVIPAISAH